MPSAIKLLPIIIFVFLLGIIFIFSNITEEFNNNMWSIDYFNCLLENDKKCYSLYSPPIHHLRGPLWLAREYLSEGIDEKAFSLANGLAKQGNIDAQNIIGQILATRGDYSTAKDAWITAGAYQQATDAAIKATDDGRLQDALLAYQAAQIINPEEGTIPFTEFLWFPYENHKYAERLLLKTIWDYPNSPNINIWKNRLGKLYRDQQRWNEAYPIYIQILSEYPDNWQATIGLGWTVYYLGEELEATKDIFLRGIQLHPERWNSYYAIGEIYAQDKQYKEADEWFKIAINHNSNLPDLYIQRANYLRESGDISKAIIVYNDAINLFPSNHLLFFELAWSYKLNDEPQKALDTIELAITLNPVQNHWYFTRAGQIYEWVGNLPKAKDNYSKAIKIDPTNLEAQDGIRRTTINEEY